MASSERKHIGAGQQNGQLKVVINVVKPRDKKRQTRFPFSVYPKGDKENVLPRGRLKEQLEGGRIRALVFNDCLIREQEKVRGKKGLIPIPFSFHLYPDKENEMLNGIREDYLGETLAFVINIIS